MGQKPHLIAKYAGFSAINSISTVQRWNFAYASVVAESMSNRASFFFLTSLKESLKQQRKANALYLNMVAEKCVPPKQMPVS